MLSPVVSPRRATRVGPAEAGGQRSIGVIAVIAVIAVIGVIAVRYSARRIARWT
jgi:hypothetical protein